MLCEYARNLTRNPEEFISSDSVEKLKLGGLSDSAILDSTLVVSYFNFVNRIVLSLGVESTEEEIKGYHFE
jgi:alkylhydroperoxidase family enzyme